jgi:glycosyltransferase involved in cell wall biosynthesis
MKVLFHTDPPFSLAHGGVRTLVEALMQRLPAAGVGVEPVKWWESSQTGDIVHFFGRPSISSISLAGGKGYKIVFSDLLDSTASRSGSALAAQRVIIRLAKKFLGGMAGRLAWDAYSLADAIVYLVPNEERVSRYLFGTPADRCHTISLGLDNNVLAELSKPVDEPGEYLVSIGTICERKQTVLLAEAARLAKVPVVFLGKPYSESDDYFVRFKGLVDDDTVRYPGFVPTGEKTDIIKRARGFTLLSDYESGCLAVHEAAAAGLPLLLSDLPWAHESYPDSPHISVAGRKSSAAVADRLKEFHASAKRQTTPIFSVRSWDEVARTYADLYSELLRGV